MAQKERMELDVDGYERAGEEGVESMTNAAEIGYAIMAAKTLSLDEDTIKKLESEMYHAMDWHTEEEAEEVYVNT